MTLIRTSHSHPLQIASVRANADHGCIGITFCPGKHDSFAATGSWARDLEVDLNAIQHWGADLVLTLVEPKELVELKVPQLGQKVQNYGMKWRHLPIADYSVPDKNFEEQWQIHGPEIRNLLCNGKNVLIHCKGGLGRAGMIAARLLVELGMMPEEAITLVRRKRKGAIETHEQLTLVQRTQHITQEVEENATELACA